MSPYTPATARAMTATAMLPAAAVEGRRNGGCSGSLSRVTRAETTRWPRNWCACSSSRLDATSAAQPAHVPVQAEHPAGERHDAEDHEDLQEFGVPAEVRAGAAGAVPDA